MPQLDQYIFLHEIVTLIFAFFLLYAYVRRVMLPQLNAVLKYRTKKIAELWEFDRGHKTLYSGSNAYYTWMGVIFLRTANPFLTKVFSQYTQSLEKKIKHSGLQQNNVNPLTTYFLQNSEIDNHRLNFYKN